MGFVVRIVRCAQSDTAHAIELLHITETQQAVTRSKALREVLQLAIDQHTRLGRNVARRGSSRIRTLAGIAHGRRLARVDQRAHLRRAASQAQRSLAQQIKAMMRRAHELGTFAAEINVDERGCTALKAVGIEQCVAPFAFEHSCELPSQIAHII